jgi:iron complex outermembrane receptor protein
MLPLAFTASPVMAESEEVIEEVVVTGVRGKPRTVRESPVPVDVFSSQDLEDVAFTDMNDILRTLVPSYGLEREAISDGATFIRPAKMRGLPTDKTLVLVNGKRRHRAALVEIGGTGAQGPDLATIPASAIKSIEIVRDGATALYGSDAIAGVLNFILKDDASGGSFAMETGRRFAGDGKDVTLTGNIGFALGTKGFLNVSGEFSTSDPTYRGEQYCRTVFCLDPAGDDYAEFIANGDPRRVALGTDPDFLAAAENASLFGDVVQPWGAPNAEAMRFFFNAGMPITDSVDFYAFGNYSDSDSDGSFFYRYPYNGVTEDLREPDGSIYNPLEKYPGGFTPRFFGYVEDTSFAAGLKSEDNGPLSWDISARYGESTVDYTLANTVNPSMGPASPTSFNPGSLTNTETQLQADFSYDMSDALTLVFGASYLDEEYEISEGEADSYRNGPYSLADPWDFCNNDGTPTDAGAAVDPAFGLDCSDDSDPVYRAVGVGSNGFPGYSPEFSSSYSRDSFAVYVEANMDVTDALFAQAALRYEDYDDFGSEVIYKIAGKYDISDIFGVRASFNTGFRAPTPGQQGTTNVSTRLPNGFPVATGLFPAGGPIAQALGAEELDAETSEGLSIGFVGNLGALDFTVDYYTIDIEDYFSAVSTRDVSTDPTDTDAYANFLALDGAGVAGANTIGGVFFFTNAYDVNVSGVDAVITYPIESDLGMTDVTFTYGFTEFEFDSDPSGFRNTEAQFDDQNFDPNSRAIFQIRHAWEDYAFLLRTSYWGESENYQSGNIQDFDPVSMTDLQFTYFGENFMLTMGGMNVFDEYPNEDEIGDYCCGRIYPSPSNISWMGGRWYVKASKEL